MARRSFALMESDPDDADLLRAFAGGDRQAFATLYDRYDPAAFLFVKRMLGPRGLDAAEDLHQEAWVAVARSATRFDPSQGNFRTWLFTIARRKVWDYVRRQKVAVLAAAVDEALLVPDPGETPEAHTLSRELAHRLVAAVEVLPLAQRETFMLFTEGGLSLEDIAIATEVGLETAKSRLRYARAALKTAFAAERPSHA